MGGALRIPKTQNNLTNPELCHEPGLIASPASGSFGEAVKRSTSRSPIQQWSAVSSKGDLHALNEDAFLVMESYPCRMGELFAFGVMDGHGRFGHHASRYVRDRLKLHIAKTSKRARALPAMLTTAFTKVDKDLRAQDEINMRMSGTTCCIAVITRAVVQCANVGDSRCILIERDKMANTIRLSFDHNTHRHDETERIHAAGATLSEVKSPSRASPNGSPLTSPGGRNGTSFSAMSSPRSHGSELTFEEATSPRRVWGKGPDFEQHGNVQGLNMTRSLGDLLLTKVGVIHEPEITSAPLDENKSYWLVVASDGVWRVLTEDEVVNLLRECTKPTDASDILLSAAKNAWHDMCIEDPDDITIVVAVI